MADRVGLFRSGSPATARVTPMPTQPGGQRQTTKHHLRLKEREALTEMIQTAVPMDGGGKPLFADAAPQQGNPSAVWRLLIFDDVGRDIIAPLLKVGSLRELGVTLYMHINTERDPVPGAPAIYFCAPTEENITHIAKDCGARLYEWVYVNFTAQVPRQQLESLAQQLVATQLSSIHHIRVLDRTLSYVALDNDFFSLMLPRSFLTLNRRSARDEDIDAHINAIVLGISHVLLSLQALPVIAHSKTGPAEEVARRLGVRLADAQKERQLVPAPTKYFGRPLLLLVDRASDLATALHHPFTYRGLLVDEADMRLNKCTVRADDGRDEIFEVDPDRDTFYAENASLDFGTFGGKFDAALKAYKEEYAALAVESTDAAGGDDGDDGGANAVSRLLVSAPLLAERKRYLDAHSKLANGFLSLIRAKHLDSFHGVELGVLQRSGLDKEEFSKLLSTKAGSLADRQRLYLIAYLMCTGQGDDEAFVQRMLSYVEQPQPPADSAGGAPAPQAPASGPSAPPSSLPSFPALEYLKHLRSWSLGAHSPSAKAPGGASSDGVFGWAGFAQQVAKNIASTLGANVETELPLTKLVSALLQDPQSYVGAGNGGAVGGGAMGGGPGAAGSPISGSGSGVRAQLLETVSGYDPHTRKAVNLADTHFSQVIVFTIGGGSIAEYDDLKKWEAARPHKAVTYGCTAITSGEEMLGELSVLGTEAL